MNTQQQLFRCWLFFILAASAAYVLLFESVVHAAGGPIDLGGGRVLDYISPSSESEQVQSWGTGAFYVHSSSFGGQWIWAGGNNISWARYSGPTFEWSLQADGSSPNVATWLDRDAPETRACTVNVTARNKGYHAATWQVIPGGQVYNIPGQSTVTQTVQLSATVGSILNIDCSTDYVYDLAYDPMLVVSGTSAGQNVFDRGITISPNVKQGEYQIRFIFLNYASEPVNVEIKLGGLLLGSIAARSGPGGVYTQFDVVVTVPEDVGSYFEFSAAGHTVTGVGLSDPDLSLTTLNTFTRAIDIPAGMPPPTTATTPGGSTTVVPPPGGPGGAGSITQGGPPDPQNTSTNPRDVIPGGGVTPPATNPATTAGGQGTLDSQTLKDIAKNTKDTADATAGILDRYKNAAKNQAEYYAQDPGLVVNTLVEGIHNATNSGAQDIANAIGGTGAISAIKTSMTMPETIPLPTLIVKIPAIGSTSASATVDFDLNPFTNTTSRTFTVPLSFFVKAIIAASFLYWTWMYISLQISNLVDTVYTVPNHLGRPTHDDSVKGIWAQIGSGIAKVFVSVPLKMFVATAVVMLVPICLAFVETNMGTGIAQIAYMVADKFGAVKSAFTNGGGSDVLYAILGITFQLVPVFTIFTCLFWRFVVIHALIMIKPVAYSVVRYLNP